MQEMTEAGLEIVNWGINDPDSSHRADYDFYSVMKFPNQELMSKFEEIVEGAGWYNYFMQVNISGEASTPEVVIGKMMEL